MQALCFSFKEMASTLPQREQNSFKALFKFYENKQYKKGLKTANEILKKFPEHGGNPHWRLLEGGVLTLLLYVCVRACVRACAQRRCA